MMKRLTPEDGDLLARYDHVYDELVRSIRIDFPSRETPFTAEVVILTREAGAGPGWVYLRLRFHGVSAFRLSEGNVTYRVLGDGAQLVWTDKGVTLNMDPGPDGIDNPGPNYRSGFFVTGAWCEWEEVPYTEPSKG
jgi:hypothetical protein